MSEARKEAVIGIGCPRMISAEFVRDIMGWANSSNLYGVGIAWEQTPNRIDWLVLPGSWNCFGTRTLKS